MAADFSKYRSWKGIERDIGELSIQGARNVALGSLYAIRLAANEVNTENGMEFSKRMGKIATRVMNIRPTEPMTRALVSGVIKYGTAAARKGGAAADARKKIKSAVANVEKMMERDRERMAETGANYIKNGTTVMTYCHSSSVTNVIKRAHDEGKIEKVFVCETRPRYQGRITAAELAGHGVNTHFIVDGATATYAKKADIAIVGADAITPNGDLINKIGSRTLSMIFKTYAKPFVSVAEALKFDPKTGPGEYGKIENRDVKEVWDRPPKGLKILNPAFDQTPAKNITAYITNVGTFRPSKMETAYKKANEKLGRALGS